MSSGVLFESVPRAPHARYESQKQFRSPKSCQRSDILSLCPESQRPTSQWCLEEPDLERGCGPDDYEIGEGVIPYPV